MSKLKPKEQTKDKYGQPFSTLAAPSSSNTRPTSSLSIVQNRFMPLTYQQFVTLLAVPQTPPKKTSTSQKPTTPITPSKQECSYMKKNLNIPIVPIEPEYLRPGATPREIAQNIFPKQWHFLPKSLEKSRLYYEFILVDTDSITLTHEYGPQNPQNILYSKIKINKVLSVRQWENLFILLKLSAENSLRKPLIT
ncbi:Enzymatic polyprotein [Senna tora]|uniref:Enzymatic polyprotein n=1 Tax=Senna tora TaxID=362788 RepID=A0A834U4W2_9FABA|nr:Enzymatic polyprotein [Senna tora]